MVKTTGPQRPDRGTIGESAGGRDYPMSTHATRCLMFHDCRYGRPAPLAHHHDATTLAALVLASTPIDAGDPVIFWPDVASKPPTTEFARIAQQKKAADG